MSIGFDGVGLGVNFHFWQIAVVHHVLLAHTTGIFDSAQGFGQSKVVFDVRIRRGLGEKSQGALRVTAPASALNMDQ